MHDIQIVPHDTNWWVLNGKVRQGPYISLKLASRIAFVGRSSLQRIVVLNEKGVAIMYWPKPLGALVSLASGVEEAEPHDH